MIDRAKGLTTLTCQSPNSVAKYPPAGQIDQDDCAHHNGIRYRNIYSSRISALTRIFMALQHELGLPVLILKLDSTFLQAGDDPWPSCKIATEGT